MVVFVKWYLWHLYNLLSIFSSFRDILQNSNLRHHVFCLLIINELYITVHFYIFRLTLNLKRVNSVDSPDSCEVNYTSSIEKVPDTLSSDTTYHTAPNTCSPRYVDSKLDPLMSDSGVELRTSSRPQDESDLSSNEDKVGLIFNDLLINIRSDLRV